MFNFFETILEMFFLQKKLFFKINIWENKNHKIGLEILFKIIDIIK